MARIAKRERGDSTRDEGVEAERLRKVNREKESATRDDFGQDESPSGTQQDTAGRRDLRSNYLGLMNKISDVRDELSRPDSEKFTEIFNEVETLHQLVQKPREQVADAEALLDLANTLVNSVKVHSNEGVNPADFVNCLLQQFGKSDRILTNQENSRISINWKEIGLAVSPAFKISRGCCAMLGPMKIELKTRKPVARRRQSKTTAEQALPEEVVGGEEKTDTDKNMATIFGILKRKKQVVLESLILNRKSFAQTMENLFALSFLVKDGRVEITVDESGCHIVSAKNAPGADSVMSGKVSYRHFVFRFDFKDWKLMANVVPIGEELMPHRERSDSAIPVPFHADPATHNSEEAFPTTPIRKLSRNRGLIRQEEPVVEDTPNIDGIESKTGISRRKHKQN